MQARGVVIDESLALRAIIGGIGSIIIKQGSIGQADHAVLSLKGGRVDSV